MFDLFSTTGFKSYTKKAQKILNSNWTGNYTKSAPRLYPHQWSWDSGFIAIGYAHYNEDRAMKEIRSLFMHQWDNGMVPQIVFNTAALGNYFPEPEFWQEVLRCLQLALANRSLPGLWGSARHSQRKSAISRVVVCL